MTTNLQIVTESTEACARCDGTGWEIQEGRGARPCQCKQEEKIQKALAAARIPLRYADASFDNYQTHCPALHRALQVTQSFTVEHPKVDCGLLFLGSCGVGKTHLAIATLKAIIRKGSTGLFYDYRDLLKDIQDTYNPETKTTELDVLAPVFNSDILVLDELGASKPTEWVQETITYVINQRYNENRITIFTSNYLDKLPDGAPAQDTLTDRVGVRLRSRLAEMCRSLQIEAPDYRQRIAERLSARFIYR